MRNKATDGYFKFYLGDRAWQAFALAYGVEGDTLGARAEVERVLANKLGSPERADGWMHYELPVLEGISAAGLFEAEDEAYAAQVVRAVVMSMP